MFRIYEWAQGQPAGADTPGPAGRPAQGTHVGVDCHWVPAWTRQSAASATRAAIAPGASPSSASVATRAAGAACASRREVRS